MKSTTEARCAQLMKGQVEETLVHDIEPGTVSHDTYNPGTQASDHTTGAELTMSVVMLPWSVHVHCTGY